MIQILFAIIALRAIKPIFAALGVMLALTLLVVASHPAIVAGAAAACVAVWMLWPQQPRRPIGQRGRIEPRYRLDGV